MKIGEANRVYSAQVNKLQNQKRELTAQKKAYEKGELDLTEEQADRLVKSLDKVRTQCEKASEFMGDFTAYKNMLHDAEVSRQQSDAMAEKAEEDAKCMEIMRRISRGDKVPLFDEQKLLNYNAEMYQMAKNMAMLAENKNREEHDSLWDEEENPANEPTAGETVDNTECAMEMPAEIAADEALTE